MTEGAFRMTERTLRMTCKGCYAGAFREAVSSASAYCRNGGRTFPSLRGALLPQGNNDVMQGHFAKRHHLHLHIAVMVGEHFRACEGHFCLEGIMMLCRAFREAASSVLTNCRNGGRTFPSLRGALLPPWNNDVMQGHFAKRYHLHIAVMVGEHFRACEGTSALGNNDVMQGHFAKR